MSQRCKLQARQKLAIFVIFNTKYSDIPKLVHNRKSITRTNTPMHHQTHSPTEATLTRRNSLAREAA